MTRSKMIPVISLPSGTIFAQRTEAGGICYMDDTIGGGCPLVDMTIANPSHLKVILEMHDYIDKNFEKILKFHEKEKHLHHKEVSDLE
jgi:hypothetical protein